MSTRSSSGAKLTAALLRSRNWSLRSLGSDRSKAFALQSTATSVQRAKRVATIDSSAGLATRMAHTNARVVGAMRATSGAEALGKHTRTRRKSTWRAFDWLKARLVCVK